MPELNRSGHLQLGEVHRDPERDTEKEAEYDQQQDPKRGSSLGSRGAGLTAGPDVKIHQPS